MKDIHLDPDITLAREKMRQFGAFSQQWEGQPDWHILTIAKKAPQFLMCLQLQEPA